MATKEKNKEHHSFYKEANKSILGQQQWNPKKVGKTVMKVIKWLVFGFLIVATLWGCVNEFIIKTSHNLGQGVEFYQSRDFVYPNMYQASEIVGYTAASQEVSSGVNGKKSYFDEEDKSLPEALPFQFYSINPNYKLNIDNYNFGSEEAKTKAIEDLQIDKYIVKAEDIKSIEQKRKKSDKVVDAPELYSYNLNEASVILTNLFSYDASLLPLPTDSSGIMTPSSSLVPDSIKEELNQKIDDKSLDDDHKYKVDGWMNFEFYIYDNEDGTLDGVISEGNLPSGEWTNGSGDEYKKDLFELDDDVDTTDGVLRNQITGTNGTITPNNFSTFNPTSTDEITNVENWKTIYSIPLRKTIPAEEGVDEKIVDDVEGQVIRAINSNAFYNGTGKSDYNDLINNNDELRDAIENNLKDQEIDPSVVEGYSVDYTKLNIAPKDSHIYGGSQTAVIPIKKGFPIKPSDETIKLIEGQDGKGGYRASNFESRSLTNEANQGFDGSVQNFGWMLMDSDGNLKRVYDNKDDALKGTSLTSEDEANALYGDQRRLGWGTQSYDGTSTDEESVFDEKVKTLMGEDKYVSLHHEVKIGDTKIKYNSASRFAGVTSALEIQNFTSSARGTLPKYVKQSDNTYWETSLLSDSINPTGQDSWNESRVAFQGWGDWGKAWDVNKFGLLYGAFVFPISQFAMDIGQLFHYQYSPWGTVFSIFIIVFLVRGLGSLLSMKGTKNQLKMQEVQTDVAKIKAKYSKYDLKEDKKMKQKQQLEIMALYKKNEVNPMGSLGTIFVTMPIFISLWIIISALPAYKIAVMGNFSFSVSAWYGMFNLGLMFFLYLMVGITVGLVQGISSKLPSWLANKRKGIKRVDEATKKSMKKQNRTQNIMVGVFIFMGLTVPAMFAIYWIASGLFTIFLELGRHAFRVSKANKVKASN